jgi:hypothetical protein
MFFSEQPINHRGMAPACRAPQPHDHFLNEAANWHKRKQQPEEMLAVLNAGLNVR